MNDIDSQQQPSRSDILGRAAVAFIHLLGCLPLRLNRRLGAALGYLVWLLAAKTKKVTRNNIDLCFPDFSESEKQLLVKRSVIETIKTAAETAALWRQPYAKVEPLIERVSNLDLFKNKYQRGRGVLLLVPHLGNWEALGQYVPQHFDTTAMYQPADNPQVEKIMRAGRTHEGVKLAPANRQGVIQALKVLAAGQVLVVLPDQVPEGGGEWVEFFGQSALTLTLVHKLIRKTDCEVILGVAWRTQNGFEIEFSEPAPEIKHEQQDRSLLAMNQSIEVCVRKHPEQYQWEYNRFKRRRRKSQ